MPKPFIQLSLTQFLETLQQFRFTRQINAVHMHHTFRPNHAQYRGLASIESMFEFHTRERHFNDIAQHITIAPDGTIFTGRNWNSPPASATGHNGSSAFGPFMFETIGDFDRGNDPFEDPQRNTVLQVIAAVQQRFGLPPEALRFHRQMADKSCPGTGIDFDDIVAAVRQLHTTAAAGARAVDPDAPFSRAFREDALTAVDRGVVERAIEGLGRDSRAADASDGELPEKDDVFFTSTGAMTAGASRGGDAGPDLAALRPHVIDLKAGKLIEGGRFFTLPEDVERLFGEDMERAFDSPASVGMPERAPNDPFRVMIWAHGGLIGEAAGLAIAQKHLQFWKANGIYPVYFVWETGFLQTIGQLLRGIVPAAGERNLVSDFVTDPILERTARAAGGEKIWSGMKRNAEIAATPAGGATKAAAELAKFCARHAGAVELHAGGHSAGAIFHADFLPAAFDAGIAEFAGLHVLAPAIRVDAFVDRLLPLVGSRIRRASLFTMIKEKERDDNCALIYRKSLLYLIRFALEQEDDAEILGLEESLRRSRDVARVFGLGGAPAGPGDAVFSPSIATDGPSATQALSHVDFDDDASTMNSLALRVLQRADRSQLRMPYPEQKDRALDTDIWIVPEVAELQRSFASAVLRPALAAAPAAPAQIPSAAVSAPQGPVFVAGTSGGRRRALCVGIDRYPMRPLAGCVADAKLWAKTLQSLGFDCTLLLDEDATYDAISSQLDRLIASARSGDVVVWQYAGHGTQVPDVNGDEADGDSPGQDEAICPVDLQSGRFFIDDEIGALTERLAPGAQLTMFIDCCHSGTINRFGFGEPPPASAIRDERARFMPLTDDLKAAYLQFAQGRSRRSNGSRGLAASRTRGESEQRNEVLFSACLSTEVAWESNGQGEFTLRATRLLGQRGTGVTNEAFMTQVIAAFGANPRQTPNLSCAAPLRTRGLLQPADGRPSADGNVAMAAADRGASGRFATVAGALDTLARELRTL